MSKITKIVILSSFLILGAVNSQASRTVLSSKATQHDVDLLRQITWREALPLVLFTNDRLLFRCPAGLNKANIKDGRLVTGTEFIKPASTDQHFFSPMPEALPQIFFCPNPNAGNNCLSPIEFENSQILQCEHEPMPVLEPNPRKKCGPTKNGTMMRFLYKICPSKQPYNYVSSYVVTYSFCYDAASLPRILFVDYNLSSVKLLSEKLLTREREIKSDPEKETYNIIDPLHYRFLDDILRKMPLYKLQTLVPIDHMALATWRKTTNTYANLGPQHENLIKLWDDINLSIKTDAENSINSPRKITTGVFGIPNTRPDYLGPNQIYSIWITIIIEMNDDQINGKITTEPTKGIAILMNNFIQYGNIFTSSSSQFIDNLCNAPSSCVDTLKGKFKAVNGEVRCCPLTNEITHFFWGEERMTTEELELLQIRGITYRLVESKKTEPE